MQSRRNRLRAPPPSAADSAEAAVRDTDLVICIAATMEPVVQGGWLSGGSTLIAAGPTTWRAREVDDAALTRADRWIIDSMCFTSRSIVRATNVAPLP